ncbi:MAG: adenine deaminase [Myxococcota bacterium]|jgi:adenine deaminase|nr:adenine deaminase [Myxococcota bacterium]
MSILDHHEFIHREAALGARPADLVLSNCRMVNVLSGRIEEGASIAISGDRIVGIGDYSAAESIDVKGQFVYPGLMDAHIHLESSKLTIPECARAMNRCGTTGVVTDPHEIANVASIEGISYQLDSASGNDRMSVFFTVPSCVPAIPDPEIETFAAYMGPTKLRTFFNNPWFVVLGEMMNMPGAIYGDKKVLAKLADFHERGLPIDGHAPMLRGKELNTYVYLGIGSDHESTTREEAQEKLDRGMFVMIREGSSESNLEELLPLVNPLNASRFMFASDDLDPVDLVERGHINYAIRTAVARGLDPIRALQMASINVANYFRLPRVGAIYPGALADLVISPDLENFWPSSVIRHGRFVIRDGVEQPVARKPVTFLRSMMNVSLPPLEALAVHSDRPRKMRCIDIIEQQIVTQEGSVDANVADGRVWPNIDQNLAKLCVFERHRNSGSFGVGFIRGLGLRRGAIASSVAHDSHNIIVAGVDDESILRAASRVRDLGGGQVAVAGDAEACIPLPVAGLMSDAPFEEVVKQERAFTSFCRESLGSPLRSMAATLSFMALPVIPSLRLTDKGLVQVKAGQYPRRVGLFFD